MNRADGVWPPVPLRLLVVDVDGTMTDGGMYFTAEGLSLKRFDVKDGLGLVRLQQAGVQVAIVTADHSPITQARARKLGIGRVVVDEEDKGRAVRSLLAELGVSPAETCYMGDDVNDLPAFAEVAHPVAPADAHPQVRAAAEYVAAAPGGHGAVREVCDLILAARAERASG